MRDHVFKKLKGIDVLVIRGNHKRQMGTVVEVGSTGTVQVSLPGIESSTAMLQTFHVDHLLYRWDRGSIWHWLDENHNLQHVPAADKYSLLSYYDIITEPHSNFLDHQYDIGIWKSNTAAVLGKMQEATMPQLDDLDDPWVVGERDRLFREDPRDMKLLAGHYLQLLQQREMTTDPNAKVMFKVRQHDPDSTLYAGFEGYFSGMDGGLVKLTVTKR